MMISKRFYGFITLFILGAFIAGAQEKPIGYWDSFLPYNSSVGMATDGATIYNACSQGFFTYNTIKNELEAYSKVNGMSDIGLQCVGYDALTSTAVLVYTDGNIDLFKDNTFYNMPDLELKVVSGSKAVYHVYTENGTAYLSSALGVLVIDLAAHNFSETYQFNANGEEATVLDFTGVGDSFYAVTSAGLYCAPKKSPELQNFAVWQCLDNVHTFSNITSVGSKIYLSNSSTVYQFEYDTVLYQTISKGGGGVSSINERVVDTALPIYVSGYTINHVDGGLYDLYISQFNPATFSGVITILGSGNQAIDTFFSPGILVQTMQLPDSTVWIANSSGGLEKREVDTGQYQILTIPVPGPVDVNSFGMYVNNRDLWVAHGSFDDLYTPNGDFNGFSHYSNNTWVNWGRGSHYFPFDTLGDFCVITKDPVSGNIYAGSDRSGLFILKPDGNYDIIKDNGIFDPSAQLSDSRQLLGVAFDTSHNLWVSELFPKNQHQLYAMTPDSNWYAFSLPCADNGGPLVIDDYGQVWFVALEAAGASSSEAAGVGVYNTGGTISNPSDDTYYCLQTGVGQGNLPSNSVFCIAKDLDNNIWIGTANGIGIVSNCVAPFNQQSPPCDAELPIVQYDQFAGYLFAGYNIRAIAVDGANRKWVGTDNGVWLLSPDASQIVYQFTQSNSPLPSNYIQSIAVDPVTGDVYIGTDEGLVSFRSTATEGGTTNSNVVIFPDPVPSGYTGTIAITGLVANADVRITDISGNLVYRTTALGGQAVWNGVDYKGHRPQSGVYLVFASSSDGSQTWSGKMVFIQ